MRLIDPDELRKVMYHEAFETDSDMQKWDGGCWIRYKMFEKAIDSVPTIEAEPVRHGRWLDGNRGKHDGTLYWYRYCSECFYERNDCNSENDTKYCPNCGAIMEVSSEDL